MKTGQAKELVSYPLAKTEKLKTLGPKSEGFHVHFLVAGVGFEPTAFGLWARRATTAPPRGILFDYGISLGGKVKPSTISTAQLNELLRLHPLPIKQVVFLRSYLVIQWEISSWGGLRTLDAFSAYPIQT